MMRPMILCLIVAVLTVMAALPAAAGLVDEVAAVFADIEGVGLYAINGDEAKGYGPGVNYRLYEGSLATGTTAALDIDLILAQREGTSERTVFPGVSVKLGHVGRPVLALGLAASGKEYGDIKLTVDGKQVLRTHAAPYVALIYEW